MRISALLKTIGPVALCLCLHAQTAQEPQTPEIKGMSPRATPNDYQSHQKVGPVTLAADFTQHSISDLQGTMTSDEYIVVELGVFGAPGAHTTLSTDNFSLRINGNKKLLPSVPYGMVLTSLKDPNYVSPDEIAAKEKKSSSTSIGGGGQQGNDPPPVIHIPLEKQREWAKRARAAALPEGDRSLPIAGLLFFHFTGKANKIHSIDLVYEGPAGKTTLALQP